MLYLVDVFGDGLAHRSGQEILDLTLGAHFYVSVVVLLEVLFKLAKVRDERFPPGAIRLLADLIDQQARGNEIQVG